MSLSSRLGDRTVKYWHELYLELKVNILEINAVL